MEQVASLDQELKLEHSRGQHLGVVGYGDAEELDPHPGQVAWRLSAWLKAFCPSRYFVHSCPIEIPQGRQAHSRVEAPHLSYHDPMLPIVALIALADTSPLTCSRDEYPATVVRVIDGDTIELDIELGMGVSIVRRARLRTIDTPERFTARGKLATAFTTAWVEAADHSVVITDHGPGKYSLRRIMDVRAAPNTETLSDALRAAGHVK